MSGGVSLVRHLGAALGYYTGGEALWPSLEALRRVQRDEPGALRDLAPTIASRFSYFHGYPIDDLIPWLYDPEVVDITIKAGKAVPIRRGKTLIPRVGR